MPGTLGINTYRREIVEDAVKLTAHHNGSWVKVQKDLALKYPNSTIPTTRTLKTWSRKFEKLGEKKDLLGIRDNPEAMWLETELMALHKLIDNIKDGEMSGRDLYYIAGIAADKRMRMRELDKGKTQNIRVYQYIEDARKELENQLTVKNTEYKMLTRGAHVEQPDKIISNIEEPLLEKVT